eukprot:PLAT8484.1.p1 GENE.PLAT8484.1~~PLAT8484.1.p1  ORF type:complete len:295 (-),score=127.42 PLAT8484.1:66-950(-)
MAAVGGEPPPPPSQQWQLITRDVCAASAASGVLLLCYLYYLKVKPRERPLSSENVDFDRVVRPLSAAERQLLESKLKESLLQGESILWQGMPDVQLVAEDAVVRAAREASRRENRLLLAVLFLSAALTQVLIPALLWLTRAWAAGNWTAFTVVVTLDAFCLLFVAAGVWYCRACDRDDLSSNAAFVKAVYALTDRRAVIVLVNMWTKATVTAVCTAYDRMDALRVVGEQSIFFAASTRRPLSRALIVRDVAVAGGGTVEDIGFRHLREEEVETVEAIVADRKAGRPSRQHTASV